MRLSIRLDIAFVLIALVFVSGCESSGGASGGSLLNSFDSSAKTLPSSYKEANPDSRVCYQDFWLEVFSSPDPSEMIKAAGQDYNRLSCTRISRYDPATEQHIFASTTGWMSGEAAWAFQTTTYDRAIETGDDSFVRYTRSASAAGVALETAVQNGIEIREISNLLIHNNFPLESKDDRKSTLIEIQSFSYIYPQIFDQWLELYSAFAKSGADINKIETSYWPDGNSYSSPIHWAANHALHGQEDTRFLEESIEAGADVNLKITGGSSPDATPLHVAASAGRTESAKILRTAGAVPQAAVYGAVNYPRTPAEVATDEGHFQTAAVVSQGEFEFAEEAEAAEAATEGSNLESAPPTELETEPYQTAHNQAVPTGCTASEIEAEINRIVSDGEAGLAASNGMHGTSSVAADTLGRAIEVYRSAELRCGHDYSDFIAELEMAKDQAELNEYQTQSDYSGYGGSDDSYGGSENSVVDDLTTIIESVTTILNSF